MLIVATKYTLCAIFVQLISSIFRNLTLVQQFAISNSKYLYINLKYSLIDIDFMLITNNNRDALYNRVFYYI